MQIETVATTLLLGVAIVSQGSAQERKLKRSELPAAVQRTASTQSVGAKVRGYSTEIENGQHVYEVEMTMRGHSRDVTIAADGSVLEVEEQVALDSLSEAVAYRSPTTGRCRQDHQCRIADEGRHARRVRGARPHGDQALRDSGWSGR